MPELTTIYESQGILSAQVIKSKLEAAGIPVLLKYEAIGLVYGLTVDGLGLVQVQVPAELAEDASALVAEVPPEAEEELE
jgi:NhaP-type Na+/H+ and K+/H+ antiporter